LLFNLNSPNGCVLKHHAIPVQLFRTAITQRWYRSLRRRSQSRRL